MLLLSSSPFVAWWNPDHPKVVSSQCSCGVHISMSVAGRRLSVLTLFKLNCASHHNGVTACPFSTCQLPKVVRAWCDWDSFVRMTTDKHTHTDILFAFLGLHGAMAVCQKSTNQLGIPAMSRSSLGPQRQRRTVGRRKNHESS